MLFACWLLHFPQKGPPSGWQSRVHGVNQLVEDEMIMQLMWCWPSNHWKYSGRAVGRMLPGSLVPVGTLILCSCLGCTGFYVKLKNHSLSSYRYVKLELNYFFLLFQCNLLTLHYNWTWYHDLQWVPWSTQLSLWKQYSCACGWILHNELHKQIRSTVHYCFFFKASRQVCLIKYI